MSVIRNLLKKKEQSFLIAWKWVYKNYKPIIKNNIKITNQLHYHPLNLLQAEWNNWNIKTNTPIVGKIILHSTNAE